MTYRLIQKINENGDEGVQIYTGFVTPLPGNPDVAVSHGVYRMVGDGGFGTQANRMRLDQLTKEGYSCVICTVESSNKKQIKILETNGWIKVYEFTSYRTMNRIMIFMRELLHVA